MSALPEAARGPLEGAANDLLLAALSYAARGWRVVPLHSVSGGACSCGNAECASAGKHPRIRHWPRRASAESTDIRAWWSCWPNANVAIATGRGSGIAALDIDPRHGGDEKLHDLETRHGELPATVQSLTGGGGLHILFAWDRGGGSLDLDSGVEWKADGALIVLPPSIHASGRRYVWEDSHHPDEIALGPAPAWLAAKVERPGRPKSAQVAALIPEGERNIVLTSVAGRMRLVGLPPAEMLAALSEANRTRCRPPLPASEIKQIVRNARWQATPWLTNPREFFTDDRLTPNAMLVLRVLCDHTNNKGTCWVSFELLRKRTGIKTNATLTKAITTLEAARRITVKRKHRTANFYRVHARATWHSSPASDAPHRVVGVQELNPETT